MPLARAFQRERRDGALGSRFWFMAVCLSLEMSVPLGAPYVCTPACVCSVPLPRDYNNSQRTQRLLCSLGAPRMEKKKKIWAWKSINQESRCRTLPPLLQMVQEAFHHALFSLIENVFVIWSVSQSGVQHWRLHPATSPSLHFQCQISPGVIISGVFFTTGSCSQQLPHNRIENGKRFFFNKKKKIWSNLL